MLNNINMSSPTEDDNIVPVCANCGKEGTDINNICNKCKQVRYCNAACKKKHRHKHKKKCEEHVRLAAEHAAKLHDERLFKQPPSLYGDCPICFQRLPTLESGSIYYSCCGKMICSGCAHAPVFDNQGNEIDNEKCPFCRTDPDPKSNEEGIEREKKRMDLNDPIAIFNLGCWYRDGRNSFPQEYDKALELFHRAAELGCAKSYCSIGVYYENGRGVEIDIKRAVHYYELAAMMGDAYARANLGLREKKADNMDRALKHFMIAARDGLAPSLKVIKQLYTNGHATKDDYTKALQLYQAYYWERLRVIRGTKPPQLTRGIVTIKS